MIARCIRFKEENKLQSFVSKKDTLICFVIYFLFRVSGAF